MSISLPLFKLLVFHNLQSRQRIPTGRCKMWFSPYAISHSNTKFYMRANNAVDAAILWLQYIRIEKLANHAELVQNPKKIVNQVVDNILQDLVNDYTYQEMAGIEY